MKKTFWELLREFSALRRPEGAGSRAGGFHETTILSEAAEKGDAGMEGVYLNRELSWLAFNGRVLEEAEREDVPLCERLNFLAIYQRNLDEFFMVRVGSLVDQDMLSQSIRENKTHMTAREQIRAVLAQVRALDQRKTAVYQTLMECLGNEGVGLVDFRRLEREEREALETYFDTEIAVLLSPIIVGKRQPFPFLRGGEIYAVGVLAGKNGKEKLGIIPCGSGVFPRLIPVAARQYMLSEELILHFLPKVFKGYRVKAKSLLRMTRNADIDADALYDEDLDYREFMAELVKRRRRLAPVRLELSRQLEDGIVRLLCRYTGAEPQFVFGGGTPLDLSFLLRMQDALRQRPELFYERFVPQRPPQFQSGLPILEQIRERDRLLAYPYESMKPFLAMLQEAAGDERVISIKMTLYRMARQSKVVEALIEAAENGKEVFVLVELKARFDEENNIEWSRRLEDAGCQVMYGLDGYKVHSKLCLITRRGEEQVEYYTQIGTGNYNEKTARLYTDLSLMTADPEIGLNAAAVFQALALGETLEDSPVLMVAPRCLQNQVLARIDEEIAHARRGESAYIGLKLNSLTDKTIMERLIEASQAGVSIDMVVRGICCLRPGVPGATEHLRVISIVGRFLEHSRMYLFGTGERRQIYISSADFMTRNTLRRVEVAAPIRDADLKRRLTAMFDTMLRDNQQARQLRADGTYCLAQNQGPPFNSQEFFCRQAQEAAVAPVLEITGGAGHKMG